MNGGVYASAARPSMRADILGPSHSAVTYGGIIPYSQTGIMIAPANYHLQLES